MVFNDKCLSAFTTLRIGGAASALFEARSPDSVMAAARRASSLGLPWRVLGEGSNVLASDEGVSSAVIIFRDDDAPQVHPDGLVRVSGGFPLSLLVSFLCGRGFGGFESLAGIPGTVGGAIAGNAGAYGRCVGERLRKATLLSQDGLVREVTAEEMGFSYRHSRLKESHEAVLEALFETEPCDAAPLMRIMQEKLADRAGKHPDYTQVPTAGSWFKNVRRDDGSMVAAGKLLEEAGCLGLKVGGALLWHKHANIVVTDGAATARDILSLTGEMAARVRERFGIELSPEVCWLR